MTFSRPVLETYMANGESQFNESSMTEAALLVAVCYDSLRKLTRYTLPLGIPVAPGILLTNSRWGPDAGPKPEEAWQLPLHLS